MPRGPKVVSRLMSSVNNRGSDPSIVCSGPEVVSRWVHEDPLKFRLLLTPKMSFVSSVFFYRSFSLIILHTHTSCLSQGLMEYINASRERRKRWRRIVVLST